MRYFYLKPYSGQGLLSLMVSLSLSAFLLLVIISFYSQTQQQNKNMMLQLQLQTELQRMVQTIGRDVRRAGFRALIAGLQQNNLMLFEQDDLGTSVTIQQADNEDLNSCLLFFYDLNGNGCIGSAYKGKSCVNNGKNSTSEIGTELFGYRLNKGMIESRQTYKNTVSQTCQQEECRSYLQQSACNVGGWTDLLDDTEYVITQLAFNWLAEKQGIEVKLAGYLKNHPDIAYETSIVTPLLNQGEFR